MPVPGAACWVPGAVPRAWCLVLRAMHLALGTRTALGTSHDNTRQGQLIHASHFIEPKPSPAR